MKTPTPIRLITKSESGDRSPSRLMSLLAMATGALAMPQASDADIIFTDLSGKGLNWTQIVGVSSVNGYAAIANQNGHTPNSFDHMYMVFKFKDSNLPPAVNLRYGWVDLSLENVNGAPPLITIFGYAYDDTGLPIATGVIPEPAPMALLALGALTLGAKGLRSWRRNRAAAP